MKGSARGRWTREIYNPTLLIVDELAPKVEIVRSILVEDMSVAFAMLP